MNKFINNKLVYSSRINRFILILLLIFGIYFRLQNFNLLPIDGHAMRQSDTESVAYNFAFRDSNILYPQNSLIRPITNKNAYFFLEFPVYQYCISLFYKIFGWSIAIPRIINIILFLLTTTTLYYFVKNYFNSDIALLSVFFFTFAPASIFFLGHAIHPDIFAVSMLTFSLALTMKWQNSKNIVFLWLSILMLCLATVTRPFILIALPAYLVLLWQFKSKGYIFASFILLPLITYSLWYLWILQFKSTASTNWENWVLSGQSQLFDKNILINRLILKNIIGEVMGKIISILALLGIVSFLAQRSKKSLFLLFWILGIPLYWLIAPSGNIIHQYYADIYILPVMITAAIGGVWVLRWLSFKNHYFVLPITVILMLIVAYNGIHTSKYFFNDQIPFADQMIAKDINNYVPLNDKLVYLQVNNSIPFSLYHRKGWMLGDGAVDVAPNANAIMQLKRYGAKYVIESKSAESLPSKELNLIKENTRLVASSKWSNIYKFK